MWSSNILTWVQNIITWGGLFCGSLLCFYDVTSKKLTVGDYVLFAAYWSQSFKPFEVSLKRFR